MVKKAIIEICGVQDYGESSDEVRQKYLGSFEENGEAYILRYNESKDQSVTLTAMKAGHRAELLRNRSALIIEPERRYICEYETDAGTAVLGITGGSIRSEIGGESGTVRLTYRVDSNGGHISENEVTFRFRFKI